MKETNRNRANVAKRRARQRKLRNRRIALTVCLMLVVMVASIGGTVAWLTAQSGTVTNTFTTADISIALTETKGNKFQLIPGKQYDKDPVVSVDGNKTDVDIYLFVKRDDAASAYLTYTDNLTAANGWTKLGNEDVWYRIVRTTDETKSWHLIGGDKVMVKDTVVKAGTNVTDTDFIAMPASDVTLTFTAYAVQLEGFEGKPADAWAKVAPTNP